MAVFKTAEEEREIPDGTKLEETAEAMGVPFGCHHGVCGHCKVVVLEGMENLSAKSQEEEDYDMDESERLMCQCSIVSGTVAIDA